MSDISRELREWAAAQCNSLALYALADRIDAEMVELPRDRDGAPIHVGDTVWNANKDAIECTVTSIELYEDITKIFTSSRGINAIVGPRDLTHKPKDSLERIIRGMSAEIESMESSITASDDALDALRDYMQRIKALAEKEGGSDERI